MGLSVTGIPTSSGVNKATTKVIAPTNAQANSTNATKSDETKKTAEEENSTTTNNSAEETTNADEELTPYQQGFKAAESVYKPQIDTLTQQNTDLQTQVDNSSATSQQQNSQNSYLALGALSAGLSTLPFLLSGLGGGRGNRGGGGGNGGDYGDDDGSGRRFQDQRVDAKAYDENGFSIQEPGTQTQTQRAGQGQNPQSPQIDAPPELIEDTTL